MSLSDSYGHGTQTLRPSETAGTEVDPRQLQTPCSQVDLVSRKQPFHYSRRLTGSGKPWKANEEGEPMEPQHSLYKVPSEVHPKPFNSQGAPGFNSHVKKPGYRRDGPGLPGPLGGSGPPVECVRENGPEDENRNGGHVFRGERREYTLDTKWSRVTKNKKFASDDAMFTQTCTATKPKRPHCELFLSKTALQDRWPSENKNEALWAANLVPANIDTSRKALRERPLYDPTDFRTSKYGLYKGRFDQPGTKPVYLPGDLFSGTVEPERPRWGYSGRASTRANEDAKKAAAAQRSFDILRPRNSWSCPEMGYHWTHR